MYEIEELNPSVSESTVYKHVQKLIQTGIVREFTLPEEERRQGYPWKFYGLTENGQALLEEHGLFDAKETLQTIYCNISDKSDKMVKFENAPRPTRDVEEREEVTPSTPPGASPFMSSSKDAVASGPPPTSKGGEEGSEVGDVDRADFVELKNELRDLIEEDDVSLDHLFVAVTEIQQEAERDENA